MMESRMHSSDNRLADDLRLEGKVIPVAHGEAIVFEIPLGICKLVVIANIPEDGDKATIYVKVRPIFERRTPNARKPKREMPSETTQ